MKQAATWTGALVIALTTGGAQADGTIEGAEAERLGAFIEKYLVENPEALERAIASLERWRMDKQRAATQAAIGDNAHALRNDARAPVLGNPQGDITIVEFLDYRCGYCKRASSAVKELLDTDDNVRFVVKDFPILGPVSTLAAHAAIAANAQGKYREMHDALFALDEVTPEAIDHIVATLGLDRARYDRDRASAETRKLVSDNLELGRRMQVTGTPAFVIGDEFVGGAIGFEQMKQIIAAERAKTS